MRYLVSLISRIGDWLVGLSDRTRLQLIVLALVVLGGGSLYKLVISIRTLQEPLPAATPEQLIKPLEKLFIDTKSRVDQSKQTQLREITRLDSLAKVYSQKS
jgi:hypothetical protein